MTSKRGKAQRINHTKEEYDAAFKRGETRETLLAKGWSPTGLLNYMRNRKAAGAPIPTAAPEKPVAAVIEIEATSSKPIDAGISEQSGSKKSPKTGAISEETAGWICAGVFMLVAQGTHEPLWLLDKYDENLLGEKAAACLHKIPAPVADFINSNTAPAIFAAAVFSIVNKKRALIAQVDAPPAAPTRSKPQAKTGSVEETLRAQGIPEEAPAPAQQPANVQPMEGATMPSANGAVTEPESFRSVFEK